MIDENADYRDDYIKRENIIDFEYVLSYLIELFSKMNI